MSDTDDHAKIYLACTTLEGLMGSHQIIEFEVQVYVDDDKPFFVRVANTTNDADARGDSLHAALQAALEGLEAGT